MKKLPVISIVLLTLCTLASAAPLGTCGPGSGATLSIYIGNSCTLGDKMFDNFTYSGNVAAASVSIDFQMVGTEFRVILAPVTGAGFFTNLVFTDTIGVVPATPPNVLPNVYRVVSAKDQSNFSAQPGSAGLLHVVNGPGPTFDLAPGSETGVGTVPNAISVTTTATLSGPGGTGVATPGLSSFELGYIQANVVPEPATFALIGFGTVLFSLGLRKYRG